VLVLPSPELFGEHCSPGSSDSAGVRETQRSS